MNTYEMDCLAQSRQEAMERLRREHERQAQMERDLSRANSPSPAERMESPTWNHSKK